MSEIMQKSNDRLDAIKADSIHVNILPGLLHMSSFVPTHELSLGPHKFLMVEDLLVHHLVCAWFLLVGNFQRNTLKRGLL